MADPARAGRRAAFIFIAITVCLDVLAQSITFPILPRLAQQLLGGDRAAAARWVGFLEVAWVVPQFFAAPGPRHAVPTRFGRRPVIILSVLGVGLEFVLCALAPSIGWLLFGRVLCGLPAAGAHAAAMAYVADVDASGAARTELWLAERFGVERGHPRAGPGRSPRRGRSAQTPFWAAAVVALAGGVYGFFVLPGIATFRRTARRFAGRKPIRGARSKAWCCASSACRY